MPIVMNKLRGETPLDVVRRVKAEKPELAEKKVSYAGRLDPMAEGLLLLLIGEENKKRNEIEHLDKTYVFEILFGVETDTYDILGLITKTNAVPVNLTEKLEDYRKAHIGKITQIYPPYSSKPVSGKPLYWWARHNKLSEITLPTKVVQIHSFSIQNMRTISKTDLHNAVISRLKTVSGDFRQDEIIKSWQELFTSTPLPSFQIAICEIRCSSGTYVRSLVHDVGLAIGSSALAYSIKRTAVGSYTLTDVLAR